MLDSLVDLIDIARRVEASEQRVGDLENRVSHTQEAIADLKERVARLERLERKET